MAKKWRGRSNIMGWFQRRPGWGTVYLMQPASDPGSFKIGYTSRNVTERRSELQQAKDGKLRIAYTIFMPHAYLLEGRILRAMRGGWWIFRRKGSARGTEWFRLKNGESLDDIIHLMQKQSVKLRREAKWHFSWPRDAKIRYFRAIMSHPKHIPQYRRKAA